MAEKKKEQRYIFRPYITVKGVRIYAKQYGKRRLKYQ